MPSHTAAPENARREAPTREAPTPEAPRVRSDLWSYTINHQRRGAAQADLSEALHTLVTRCKETGRKGTITLTLTVTPDPDGNTVDLVDKITVKAPDPVHGKSLFFLDDDGNLQRSDPRQRTMFDEPS